MRKILGLLVALMMVAGVSLAAAGSAQADEFWSCYGHKGEFKTGTVVSHVSWNNNGKVDECFGIGPNRVVYKITALDTAWQSLGGQADATFGDSSTAWHKDLTVSGVAYRFVIVVYVAGPPSSHWFYGTRSSDGHMAWLRCPSGVC